MIVPHTRQLAVDTNLKGFVIESKLFFEYQIGIVFLNAEILIVANVEEFVCAHNGTWNVELADLNLIIYEHNAIGEWVFMNFSVFRLLILSGF